MQKPLELPITLRTANLEEIPHYPEILEKIVATEQAKIIEGFTWIPNSNKEFPFLFFSEINIDNSRLWELFKTLFLHFPDELCVVYQHIDDEQLAFGKYMDKWLILSTLESFQLELTKDVFLKFGVYFHDQTKLIEVLVSSNKYIQYWGVDEEIFRKTMESFSLYQINDLQFIDEFPVHRENTLIHFPNAVQTDQILDNFGELFG